MRSRTTSAAARTTRVPARTRPEPVGWPPSLATIVAPPAAPIAPLRNAAPSRDERGVADPRARPRLGPERANISSEAQISRPAGASPRRRRAGTRGSTGACKEARRHRERGRRDDVGRRAWRQRSRDGTRERSVRGTDHRRRRLPHDGAAEVAGSARADDRPRDRPSLRGGVSSTSPAVSRATIAERPRGRTSSSAASTSTRDRPAQHAVRMEWCPPRLRKRERRESLRRRRSRPCARRVVHA